MVMGVLLGKGYEGHSEKEPAVLLELVRAGHVPFDQDQKLLRNSAAHRSLRGCGIMPLPSGGSARNQLQYSVALVIAERRLSGS